jgi:hypothetical protein
MAFARAQGIDPRPFHKENERGNMFLGKSKRWTTNPRSIDPNLSYHFTFFKFSSFHALGWETIVFSSHPMVGSTFWRR